MKITVNVSGIKRVREEHDARMKAIVTKAVINHGEKIWRESWGAYWDYLLRTQYARRNI